MWSSVSSSQCILSLWLERLSTDRIAQQWPDAQSASQALVIFGSMTGRDPRSLGDTECSAFELGLSRTQAKALQQIAFDQLASTGAVSAASPVPVKLGNPARCVAGR